MTRGAGRTRVVVTGMGWVTPLGVDIEGVWSRLAAGASGVGPITRFDAATFTTNFAAECEEPDLGALLDDDAPHRGAALQAKFALAAAAQAWRQAGLGDLGRPGDASAGGAGLDPRRVGLYLGSGEGPPDFGNFVRSNLAAWSAESRTLDTVAWAKAAYANLTREVEVEQEPNMALSHVAGALGIGGPSYNCLTACAASTQAVGEATETLRRGDADVMVAGGAHTMIHPLGVTGFIRLTALSSRRDDPRGASRPFSQNRDGFVMGEGAGIVVLETLEHARSRGARPLAEIAGFGSTADAFRITDIQPDGLGAQAAMRDALEQAGVNPLATGDDGRPPVHYISAHGTGTKENDSIEARAVKAVFGANAPKIPVSSIKSMMGHLIAAAGVVELITCVQAILTGVVPPTINLHTPDPECGLDCVPNASRDLSGSGGVRVALSNSFGFGGQNDTLVVKRFEA